MNRLVVLFAVLSVLFGGCLSEYELYDAPQIVEQPGKIKKRPPNIPDNETHYGTDGVNVDVLVVLDTSCSMDDDPEAIDSIPGIVTDLLDKPDINWRLGIIPADPTRTDLFTEIDLRDADAAEQMGEAVNNLMTIAPWNEFVLDTIMEFYNNELWFREVFTIFVVVTDEHEQSNMPAAKFEEDWPTRFDFVAIAGGMEFVPGCYAESAPKLIDLSTKFINICDDEPWSIF